LSLATILLDEEDYKSLYEKTSEKEDMFYLSLPLPLLLTLLPTISQQQNAVPTMEQLLTFM